MDGGILEQRREGTRAYVKADTRSPLFADLHGLVERRLGCCQLSSDYLSSSTLS